MSIDEMLQWYKDNGCVDHVYSMQSMGYGIFFIILMT